MSDKKVIISCDSSCDLGPELCERYNIILNPFRITLGDKSFIDGVEVTPDEIYEYHRKTGNLAKTSATNIAEHQAFFKEHTKDGNQLIFFTISAQMSANYRAATLAAEEMDNVFVVDSANLSTGVGLLLIAAAEMAEQGKCAEEIVKEIENLKPKVNVSFVIDSLEYLHKGGRCSALAALGANLLKLKPCIEVRNGVMGLGKKYRGRFENVIHQYVAEQLTDTQNIVTNHIFITHAGCDDEVVKSAVDTVKKALNCDEIFVTRAGATVSVHCGRNTLGVLFIQKTDVK